MIACAPTHIMMRLHYRLMEAVMWSILLEVVLLLVCLIVDVNVFHPLSWMSALWRLCSPRVWLCFIPLAIFTAALGMVYSKKLTSQPSFCGTRFSIIRNLFRLQNVVTGLLLALLSAAVTWTYLLIFDTNVNTHCVNANEACPGEGSAFLILNSLWSGIYIFASSYVFDSNSITFPVVQQLKFIQVKSELLTFLKRAALKSVWPNFYFLAIYYWKGQDINNLLGETLGKSDITFKLLFHAWILTAVSIFITLSIKHLLQVYIAEHWEFPIVMQLANNGNIPLHDALAAKELPAIQNLAFFDLMVLSEKDHARRQDLFALSQPGGHPHNWNAILQECLKLINTFSSDLNKASLEYSKSLNTSEGMVNVHSSTSPSAVNRHSFSHSMRNLSILRDPLSVQHEQDLDIIPILTRDYIYSIVKLRIKLMLDALLKKPGISYLFGTLPDVRFRYILSQGFPVVWATESISCLAASSLKEDKYGIVLKDLPIIISSLLFLKQALDKIPKSGNYKRSQKNEQDDVKMKIALKSAVKRSIYRICIVFGNSVKELELPESIQQQLKVYLSFREG